MDGSRFDALTRSLARRGLLKGLAAAAAALATGARAADASVPRCGSDADCGAIAGARCLKGGCRCPHPQIDCAGVCVDLHESDANCGRCGQACGDGQICSGSRCRCANLRQTLCAGTCVDTRGDKHNCGTCGHRCPVGNTQGCVDGVCQACPHGQVVCPGQPGCHDLLRDPNNCNGCGAKCAPGQTCVEGTCQCPAGQTLCEVGDGPVCIDLQTSDAHCGACDARCNADPVNGGQACRGGVCVCTDPALSVCRDQCFDLQTDFDHCGACGHGCPICLISGGDIWYAACRAGQCFPNPTVLRQYPGLRVCADACVDTQSDAANCGACGHACPAGVACVKGTCGCPSGQHACGDGCCADGQSCCNHTCCAVGIACANDGSCAPCPSGQRLCGSACCAAANVCCGGSCCPADVAFCDGAGGCCPPERTCNGSCCPAGQSCHNGACQPRCLPSGTALDLCDYTIEQQCCSRQCGGGGRGACTPAQSWNSCCDLDGAACVGAGFNPACCTGFCSVDPGSATGTCGPGDGVRAGKVCQQNNDCLSCQCANGVCQ